MTASLQLTHSRVADVLVKLAKVPLSGDFFEWSREFGDRWNVEHSLRLLGHKPGGTTPLADLKASIGRQIEREQRKLERGHWSFDLNRLTAYRQMLARIELYERTV